MFNAFALPHPIRLALAAALTAGALAGSALAADDAFASKAGCDRDELRMMPNAGGDSQPSSAVL